MDDIFKKLKQKKKDSSPLAHLFGEEKPSQTPPPTQEETQQESWLIPEEKSSDETDLTSSESEADTSSPPSTEEAHSVDLENPEVEDVFSSATGMKELSLSDLEGSAPVDDLASAPVDEPGVINLDGGDAEVSTRPLVDSKALYIDEVVKLLQEGKYNEAIAVIKKMVMEEGGVI